MKFYFIRHGSTDSLEKNISQPNDEPLNQYGIDQAKKLAARFYNIPINLIISSPYARALQTAQIIDHSKIITNELFVEIKKPQEVIGHKKDSEEVEKIMDKIYEMYHVDPFWHYSDEENFEDLKKRGLDALDFLKSQKHENILVVSHGHFLTLLVALMIFDKNLTFDLRENLKNFLRISNTGISVFTLENNHWKLQSWNDTSHI